MAWRFCWTCLSVCQKLGHYFEHWEVKLQPVCSGVDFVTQVHRLYYVSVFVPVASKIVNSWKTVHTKAGGVRPQLIIAFVVMLTFCLIIRKRDHQNS